jgi:hypothetical protein
MYYTETVTGWCAGEDIGKAVRFKSQKDALNRWLHLHAWPEAYEHCIKEGHVRAEPINQGTLLL